ncbi:MAG TPA: Clp protease N-terminal domain-containing protein [Patescibacteria group bacterium]
MWQRFTERARRVVFFAQEEAARLGENYVGTEHLLLGLIRESDSVAGRILDQLGIPLVRIRADIERQVTRGNGNLGQEMQLTHRGKRVFDFAYEEARLLDDKHVGTEHLLLALIREEDGLAARVLKKLGADLARTRREVYHMQSGAPKVTPLLASPEATRALIDVYDQLTDDARSRLERGVAFSDIGPELQAAVQNACLNRGPLSPIPDGSVIYLRPERSDEVTTAVEISIQITTVVLATLSPAPKQPEAAAASPREESTVDPDSTEDTAHQTS